MDIQGNHHGTESICLAVESVLDLLLLISVSRSDDEGVRSGSPIKGRGPIPSARFLLGALLPPVTGDRLDVREDKSADLRDIGTGGAFNREAETPRFTKAAASLLRLRGGLGDPGPLKV
jgi:hypothetical protein